jgi:paraquat-inducible protein B
MAENRAAVKASVAKNSSIHKIWVVPIVAFAVGLWMVYANWASQGPVIEITFTDGAGIEAGKTKVKRRNVEVGQLEALSLDEDAQNVVATVRIHKEYTDLIREDSKFWIVRPRIGRGGISGLGTLLSGAYIETSRGTAEESARTFEGLETPPVTPIGTPGLHVTLSGDGSRPLVEGQPILFHGSQVGRIEYVHFNTVERQTYYNAFIAEPYDRLITTNTRFWFANGIAVDLSADGIRVQMDSFESLIEGGVAFDVPQGQPVGERITERTIFTIYANKSAINERVYGQSLDYMLLFDASIRGLSPGAPVELRGVRVGSVLRTDIDYVEVTNLLDPNARIPVLIELEPARLGYDDTETDRDLAKTRIDELLQSGLHASIASGSLLTGQKFIELGYAERDATEPTSFADYAVIPSVGGRVGLLMDSAAKTMASLSELPLDDMVVSAKKALEQMATTLAQFDEILEDEESRAMFANINTTLAQFRKLARDYAEGSKTNEEMQKSLESLQRTLDEMQPVLRQLRDKPNSLVFGDSDEPDLEPRGANE